MNKTALGEAARWFARLGSGGATEADRRAWRDWVEAHPDHRWAWDQVEALQCRMQSLPGKVSAATFRIAGPARSRLTRRDTLKGLGIAMMLGAFTGAGMGRSRGWFDDHHTAGGEQRRIVLPDGSSLMLNTATAVDVVFDDDRRLLRMRAGEILVETAVDPGPVARPFIVETAQGEVRALGTRFIVRQREGFTSVAVLRHAVEIRPVDAPRDTRIVGERQQAVFSRAEAGMPRVADESLAAWTRGMLVVSDWRLGDLVDELARYRPGRLACDPTVAGLRISGAFPVRDTDIALKAIEQALPVRAIYRTRYWVGLGPRG
ncbi:MAG: FecR domain-containing protein [Gammaproteobacteria bacterium]|nr:FecR domain-containing protein [Gammaproteobacteria bacterium]